MLVQWAREEGWLVLYVPSAKEWTHGGFFYKHPQTGLWDTPVQAENVLKVRLWALLFLAFIVCFFAYAMLNTLFSWKFSFEKVSMRNEWNNLFCWWCFSNNKSIYRELHRMVVNCFIIAAQVAGYSSVIGHLHYISIVCQIDLIIYL